MDKVTLTKLSEWNTSLPLKYEGKRDKFTSVWCGSFGWECMDSSKIKECSSSETMPGKYMDSNKSKECSSSEPVPSK